MENIIETPIIDKGGNAIYERENQIILMDRKIGGSITLCFVLSLLTIIPAVNALIFMSTNFVLGISLLSFSALCGFFTYRIFSRIKKLKAAGPDEKTILVIIDVEQNLLLDAKGQKLAPMNEVLISKSLNITSSSPSISIKWNKGQSKIILKFNGLTGGTNQFVSYFKEKGLWN
jgi:hypothetical protein